MKKIKKCFKVPTKTIQILKTSETIPFSGRTKCFGAEIKLEEPTKQQKKKLPNSAQQGPSKRTAVLHQKSV